MTLNAYKISSRIKIRDMAQQFEFAKPYQTQYEVVFKIDDESFFTIYSFGVCTFFNTPDVIQFSLLEKVKSFLPPLDSEQTSETYEIQIEPTSEIKVEHNRILLPEIRISFLRIVSLVVAESVAIEYYEITSEKALQVSTEYSHSLKNRGTYPRVAKTLLKSIGFATATRQEILQNLYITDAPDETWNDPLLEGLFFKLNDIFDIESRFRSVNQSLNAIQESTEIMVNLLQAQKSNSLELLIVILILIEIILSFIEIPKIYLGG